MTKSTRIPRYVGVAIMGPNYAAPDVATGAYVWNTLDDVAASVRSIVAGHGVAARVAEWDDDDAPARAGHLDDSLSPCTDWHGVHVIVWANVEGTLRAAETDGVNVADYVVQYGPRGGAPRAYRVSDAPAYR